MTLKGKRQRNRSGNTVRASKRRVLFFREVNFNGRTLVFAPPQWAEEQAQIQAALTQSKTWGEFRAHMPRKEYLRLRKENPELMDFADDEIFYCGVVPGVEDAEYPHPIVDMQERVLPRDLLDAYAHREEHLNCNGWWSILPARKQALLEELTNRGFELVERQDLEFF